MAFTNYGLEKLGSFMANDTPTPPDYLVLGTGSGGFVATNNYLDDEFYRKSITWTFFENRARGNITITSTEANGSNIQEFGLGVGSSGAVGSDLYTRNLSAIGEKNNTFDVDVSFTPVFRRG